MNETVDGWMNILEQHTSGALETYRRRLASSVAANKQTHDPPVIALSIGEGVDVAAFVIIGVCPTDSAAKEVCENFSKALASSLKAEGRSPQS